MKARRRPGWYATALVLLGLVLVPLIASAQDSTTGAIVGIISDNTKAVMPGVTVTLTGPALMGSRTIVSEADGGYRFPNVPIGSDYKLLFELPGFSNVTREGIALRIGFTATVNIEMAPAGVSEAITVTGASPVVDVTSTSVTTERTAEQLNNVMGSRDYQMVMASVPGVQMVRLDVGGNNAISGVAFTAYGVANSRGEVEGMQTNLGAGGNSDMLYVDMNSFEEISVTPVGTGAESPKPGNLSSVVSKSGGNTYHGMGYIDFENSSMESYNIDDDLIRRGVAGYGKVSARDVNRLEQIWDSHADMGGFIIKDKVWWFGSARRQDINQNFSNLVDATAHIWMPITSLKGTYQVSQNNKITAFYMRGTKYHNMYNIVGHPITNAAGLTNEVYPTGNHSVHWNSIVGQKLVYVVRAGAWYDRSYYIGKCDQLPDGVGGFGHDYPCAVQYLDNGANMQVGTEQNTLRQIDRPQFNGSMTYFQDGWAGSHDLKVGGEMQFERQWQENQVFNNQVLILNNGRPSQVREYLPPSRAFLRDTTMSVYVQDSWRLNSRVTINPGLRLDHYRSWLPEQTSAYGTKFPEMTGYTFNNLGPRLGLVYAVSADQKTLLKANYGRYWDAVGTDNAYSPNAPASYATYEWVDPNPVYQSVPPPTADPRGVPIYNPATRGRLVSTTGSRPDGTASVTVDPNYKNSYTSQFASFFEREVGPNFGVRTGFVWNGVRQVRATLNLNQPFDAFTVPVTVANPGPDGVVGNSDDGPSVTAYNLDAAHLALPVRQVISNLDAQDADHYTWEVTANRRQTGWWSLLASFSETWSAVGVAATTPNQLINTTDGKNKQSRWTAKISSTLDVGYGVRMIALWRHQSGTNFAPTFQARLNYATATIQGALSTTERKPNVNVVDVRAEKNFKFGTWVGSSTFSVFADLYNVFNENAAQEINVGYGATYLRPTIITGPRIARIGARFQF